MDQKTIRFYALYDRMRKALWAGRTSAYERLKARVVRQWEKLQG